MFENTKIEMLNERVTRLEEQLEAALDALRRSWPGDEAKSRFPEAFAHESNPASERHDA